MEISPTISNQSNHKLISLAESLLAAPVGYEDYSKQSTLWKAIQNEGLVSEKLVFNLIASEKPVIENFLMPRVSLMATDGVLSVAVFAYPVTEIQMSDWSTIEKGTAFTVNAELQNWAGKLQIVRPDLVPPKWAGKIIPQYKDPREEKTQEFSYELTRKALLHIEKVVSYLNEKYQTDSRLSLKHLLSSLHEPENMGEAILAKADFEQWFSRLNDICPVNSLQITKEARCF